MHRLMALGSSGASGKLILWGSLVGPSAPGDHLPFKESYPAELTRETPTEERLSIGGYQNEDHPSSREDPHTKNIQTKSRWQWLKRD